VRVVLDTNVLVSGVLFTGAPAVILRAWARRRFGLAISPEIQDEYEDVAQRLAARYPTVELRTLFDLVLIEAEMCQAAPLQERVCTDAADDKFFACAIAAGAEVIVSGDKHLLRASGYRGVGVVTPRAFVDRYLASESGA
jgi:putative PIN family toxin of toxin-antitoxin system